MNKRIPLIMLSIAILVFAVPSALAGRGGTKGNDPARSSCSASANLVQASGLPTDQVINFLITDSSGTTGWVLGYTSDGTFATSVPTPNGPTTYAYVSRTWGNDGSKYTIFASCSA
jgi:hypothetical protein